MTLHDLIAQQLSNLLPPPDPSVAIFQPITPLPLIQITVDEPNLNKLRAEPRKATRAQLKMGDTVLEDIGIHLKGAAGSTRGWDDKPGLTLDTNKFVKGQKFFGLEKFHLNNGVQDQSYLQELLGNELALSMGLPGCRCTHALVELNGRKVGLYVLKEGFDKRWLRRNFPDAPEGNLYDGGFCNDINADLKLDVGTDNQRRDLKGLAGICQFGDVNLRYEALGRLLDIDKFCASTALQICTADWDGYNRNRNNYRVFFPKGGKAIFITHGMDQLWQNPEEGLWPGWGGMVAQAVLGHPEGKEKTIVALNEASRKYFMRTKLIGRIDMIYPRTLEGLKATGRQDWAGGFEGSVRDLKERLSRRIGYVRNELPALR